MRPTLDPEALNSQESESSKTESAASSTSGCLSLVPRAISYLYNCPEDLQLREFKKNILLLLLFYI